MQLTPDQQHAETEFLKFLYSTTETEMVIAGASGSGKSTLTKYLIEAARKNTKMINLLTDMKGDINIYCTATTNKAAGVLAEMTGEEAVTIHSLLGLKVTNDYKTGKTLLKKTRDTEIVENSLIVLDECSLTDSYLLKIIRELTLKCKLLFIGDPNQLAPIHEAKSPVFEKVANRVNLTTIKRQAQGNPILQLSDQLKMTVETGKFNNIASNGIEIIRADGALFQKLMEDEFRDPLHTVQRAKVLAWTNAKVHDYNSHIRALLVSQDTYQVGEYVATNKPIMNGKNEPIKTDSIREITDIYPGTEKDLDGWWVTLSGGVKVFLPQHQSEVKQVLKHFAGQKDWVNYFNHKDFYADLRPAHASTVFKSQGSTYETVFIDVGNIGQCRVSDTIARMMYVGITRASDKVVLYGDLPSRLYI